MKNHSVSKQMVEGLRSFYKLVVNEFNCSPHPDFFAEYIKYFEPELKDGLVVGNNKDKQQVKQDITKSLDMFLKVIKKKRAENFGNLISLTKNDFDFIIEGGNAEEKTSSMVEYEDGIGVATLWTGNHYQNKKKNADYFLLVSYMMGVNGKIAKLGVFLLDKRKTPLFFERLSKSRHFKNSAYSVIKIPAECFDGVDVICGEKRIKTFLRNPFRFRKEVSLVLEDINE